MQQLGSDRCISPQTIYTWIKQDEDREHWESMLRRRGKRPYRRKNAATTGDAARIDHRIIDRLEQALGGADGAIIGAEMNRIAAEREASQPLRSKTGGSTFKNPPGHKAWQLVDEAGCRGLMVGGAQVSEKHTNFLLNLGEATSADIEALGEDVRRRVKAKSGIELEWEIQRVGIVK